MIQPLIKFNLFLFHHKHYFYIISITNITCCQLVIATSQNHSPGSNYCLTRINLYRDGQFWIPMKRAKHSTRIKPTLGSVNGDVVGSRFSPSVTPLTPSICTWITSFRTPLRKSTQFCKSTTVMTVVLTHYMKLNTNRAISCSVKTANSCFVQIYCIAFNKITNTKETPQQGTVVPQNIMADGCTMCRVPIMSQTNPVHISTAFNVKYNIEINKTQ